MFRLENLWFSDVIYDHDSFIMCLAAICMESKLQYIIGTSERDSTS